MMVVVVMKKVVGEERPKLSEKPVRNSFLGKVRL